jgi:dihydrorhizobitoxine desaturase
LAALNERRFQGNAIRCDNLISTAFRAEFKEKALKLHLESLHMPRSDEMSDVPELPEKSRTESLSPSRQTGWQPTKETRSQIKELCRPNGWLSFRELVKIWTLIILGGCLTLFGLKTDLIALKFFALAAGWILIGTRMRALAVIQHFGAHQTLAVSKLANHLMSTILSGWPVLLFYFRYRLSHIFWHHRWLGHKDRDPDIEQYWTLGLWRCEPNKIIRQGLFDLLLCKSALRQLPYVVKDRLLPDPSVPLKPSDKFETVGFLLFWGLAIGILFWQGWLDEFLVVWAGPFVFVYLSVGSIIERAEHFCGVLYDNVLEKSRNRNGHPVEDFLFSTCFEGLHLVHHLFPYVPWHNLKAAHKVLMNDERYAEVNLRSGGIFTRGPLGQPSIISVLPDELQQLQRSGLV